MKRLISLVLLVMAAASLHAAEIEIIKRNVITGDGYCGWPTVCITKQGELIIVYSGMRQKHVDPWGQVRMIRSSDFGKTWSAPTTPVRTPLDDRDSGLIELRDGTLLLFWFNSIAWLDNWDKRLQWDGVQWVGIDPAIVYHTLKLPPVEELKTMLGKFCARSTDGGKTWSEPVKLNGSSPHGAIQLKNGKIIHAGRGENNGEPAIFIEVSSNGGKSWKTRAILPHEEGLEMVKTYEPHIAEAADGTLIVTCRYQGKPAGEYMTQSESHDGGKTWTKLHLTEVQGLPPHMITLPDGQILLTYARRKAPHYGQYVRFSSDNGKSWGEEIMIDTDINGDNGYPSTVQLPDGTFFTVYYGDRGEDGICHIVTIHWKKK